MDNKSIIIAIDGFSSCGKSTMAKDLARRIGYIYVDSGAMYRAVTLYCLDNRLINDGVVDTQRLASAMGEIVISFANNPTSGKQETYLNGVCVEQEIRNMRVSNSVSLVSQIDFVREALVAQQRRLGEAKGIVMDGRDIGTEVFPNAELKIFVTASLEVKANRRFKELVEKGEKVTYEEVVQNVKQRDYDDQHRKESPLRKAEDAIELDNSYMTFEEQDAWVLQRFKEALNRQ